MRQAAAEVLDDRDEEVALLLAELGLGRPAARILAYLAHVDEAFSADIERATQLRQPEVSVAMQRLRARRWVERKSVKGEGKGRPRYVYALKGGLARVLDDLEAEREAEARAGAGAVKRLRAMVP